MMKLNIENGDLELFPGKTIYSGMDRKDFLNIGIEWEDLYKSDDQTVFYRKLIDSKLEAIAIVVHFIKGCDQLSGWAIYPDEFVDSYIRYSSIKKTKKATKNWFINRFTQIKLPLYAEWGFVVVDYDAFNLQAYIVCNYKTRFTAKEWDIFKSFHNQNVK